jgi:hypothetical protein
MNIWEDIKGEETSDDDECFQSLCEEVCWPNQTIFGIIIA